MNEQYRLSDGYAIPKVGFGTYRLKGSDGVRRIEQALNVGYRLIDSAFNYENEGTVGKAIRQSHVARDQITYTSKLPGRHYAYADAVSTIEESLLRSGLDYIDLYLLHWPNPKVGRYVEAWQALIDAQRWGLVRSIGVCNFLPEHIDRLEKETGVLPVVNQIELHPRFNQAAQRQYNAEKQIITQAWSPLNRAGAVLDEPVLHAIAAAHQRSLAQIILRWELQLGVLPIPKSSQISRQQSNLALFDFNLSEEEMAQINQLTRADGRQKGQDPAVYEEF